MIVPVLSKQQTSTRPANGMRNGSVQKMAVGVHTINSRLVHGIGILRTVFRKGNERRIDREGELHRQLGRDDTRDDEHTVQQQLRLLQLAFDAYSQVSQGLTAIFIYIAPLTQTYQLAAMAKIRRNPMKRNDSKLFADTRSVEKIMVRTSCPWAVPNPVRSTMPRQPPSGVSPEDLQLSVIVKHRKHTHLHPPVGVLFR